MTPTLNGKVYQFDMMSNIWTGEIPDCPECHGEMGPSLVWAYQKGRWAVECPLCGHWVVFGVGK